ncbi:MAG: alpha/beta fold hydrolase [Pseudomonadota bacterium]
MTEFLPYRDAVLSALLANPASADRDLLSKTRESGEDLAFEDLHAFDSLEAIELCMQLEEKFDIDIDLANFVEKPTLNGFAARLAELVGGNAASKAGINEDLVCLKEGSGELPPLFCIHGGGGEVMAFGGLASALPEAMSVYALKMRGVDGSSQPRETIEAMATDYVSVVLSVAPKGPYYLLGYSAGGTIAFEMGRQLSAAGQDRILPIMIDSLCPTIHSKPMSRLEQMSYGAYWRPSRLYDRATSFRENRQKRQTVARERQEVAQLLEQGQPIPHNLRYRYIREAFAKAHNAYAPSRWEGDALMVRAQETLLEYLRGGKTLGWSDYVGGALSVVEIEADHHSILAPPAVDGLADLINRTLGLSTDGEDGGHSVGLNAQADC